MLSSPSKLVLFAFLSSTAAFAPKTKMTVPRAALELRGGFSPPPEVFQKYAAYGEFQAKQPTEKIIMQSILAGCYVAFGCAFAICVGGAMPGIKESNPGLQKLLFGAFGLPFALLMIILSGGQLFTGNTALITAALLEGRVSKAELLKNWVLSYFGNFAGVLAVVFAIKAAGLMPNLAPTVGVAAMKTGIPWVQAFVRGFLCNWMVCMAVWQNMCAGDVPGKVLGTIFPIAAFVSMGFEHSIANMGFIPFGMLSGADVSVSDFLLKNLVPVTLGNILSGSLVVGCAYHFIYGK